MMFSIKVKCCVALQSTGIPELLRRDALVQWAGRLQTESMSAATAVVCNRAFATQSDACLPLPDLRVNRSPRQLSISRDRHQRRGTRPEVRFPCTCESWMPKLTAATGRSQRWVPDRQAPDRLQQRSAEIQGLGQPAGLPPFEPLAPPDHSALSHVRLILQASRCPFGSDRRFVGG
eukprot:2773283-Rhodomonas_salina.3